MYNLLEDQTAHTLMAEADEHGAHSLKRELGPVSLIALGVGAIIGAGIFVMSGLGAHYAGPGLMLSFVLSGLGCAFAGLCYAEFAAMIPLAGSAYTYAYATLGELFAWIIGWDLTLEYAMGASTVSSGWSNHFIEFLNIFNLNMPLWLAYDHWTGLRTAQDIVARQMASAQNPDLAPARKAFSQAVDAIKAAQPPELIQRAHALAGRAAPVRCRDRLQPSRIPHRALITAVLVVGIKESARFNATIVAIKVARGAVRHRPGLMLRAIPATGGTTGTASHPMGFSGIGAARPTFSSPTSDLMRSPPPHRRPRIRSAICPSASSSRWSICTVLYIAVAARLTGMVPWQRRQHRSAHRARIPGPRLWRGRPTSSPPARWPD